MERTLSKEEGEQEDKRERKARGGGRPLVVFPDPERSEGQINLSRRLATDGSQTKSDPLPVNKIAFSMWWSTSWLTLFGFVCRNGKSQRKPHILIL